MVETGHDPLVQTIQDLPASSGSREDQPGLDEAFKPAARLQEVETVRPAVRANSLQVELGVQRHFTERTVVLGTGVVVVAGLGDPEPHTVLVSVNIVGLPYTGGEKTNFILNETFDPVLPLHILPRDGTDKLSLLSLVSPASPEYSSAIFPLHSLDHLRQVHVGLSHGEYAPGVLTELETVGKVLPSLGDEDLVGGTLVTFLLNGLQLQLNLLQILSVPCCCVPVQNIA